MAYQTKPKEHADRDSAKLPAGGTLTILAGIIRDHFNCMDATIASSTVAEDIDGWDSLGHAALIVRLERELSIDLGKGAMSLANVGELATRIDRARRRKMRRTSPAREEIYRSASCSVMKAGGGDGPASVFFSGLGNRFALAPAMEFERIVQECGCENVRRYYVTDFAADFYRTCSDEVAEILTTKIQGAKTFVGNSMGGYAALRFAERVPEVQRVLAIVPQVAPPRRMGKEMQPPQLRDETDYMIMFGGKADARARAHYRGEIKTPGRQRVVVVPDVNHFLVARLRDWGLLGNILRSVLSSRAWLDDVEKIVAARMSTPLPIGKDKSPHTV